MNIIIDSNSIAVFFDTYGPLTLTENGCWVGEAFNPALNTSNAQLINVDPPPTVYPNCYQREGDAWVCINQTAVDEYNAKQREVFNAEQAEKRKLAYTAEADPIYFMWQAGEATQAEWVAKREEIKARYPYSEEQA